MAASTGTLSALHEMLTEMFIQDIKLSIEEGIPMSASDKAVIVKFLKDNSITAEADVQDMQGVIGLGGARRQSNGSRRNHEPACHLVSSRHG